MLRYCDRTGEPISRRRWNELLRCREYVLVLATEVPERRRVTAEWIGVTHDCETVAKLFIVRKFRFRRRGNSDRFDWIEESCRWTATEREAVRALEEMHREK